MRYHCNHILTFIFSLLIFAAYADEPKVCFFIDDNYNGGSFCATPGDSVPVIEDKFNDRISSIVVPHGLVVSVYEHDNYAGKTQTLEGDADLTTTQEWRNLNDAISSFKVKPAACFYQRDDFTGDPMCLSAGESIDLYSDNTPARKKYHLLNPLNDGISSIKIPPGLQATVYEDDNYNGTYYTLHESVVLQDLSDIGMNNKITSVRVSQQDDVTCDRYCVVQHEMIIPVKKIFGSYWTDERVEDNDTLINFRLFSDDDYSVSFIKDAVIRIKNHEIFFVKDDNTTVFSFKLNPQSEYLSLLGRFINNEFELQYMESAEQRAIYYSPVISTYSHTTPSNFNFIIKNNNKNQPLIVDKIVMAISNRPRRAERHSVGLSACWAIPLLGIYNYIVQGKCNQVDNIFSNADEFFSSTKSKIMQIFGSAQPLPKEINNQTLDDTIPHSESHPDITGYLTYININKRPLLLTAAEVACTLAINKETRAPVRTRRNLVPPCIDWTLEILTDFTLLFGDSIVGWNQENFGRVMEQIIREGNTGYAVADTEVETRLINNVREHVTANTDHSELIHLKTAFDLSQLSYASYLHHDLEFDTVSPRVAQELPLGRYELALPDFRYVETAVRIREENQFVEHPEMHFDIEVIAGTTEHTLVARQAVIPVIEEWRQQYHHQLLFSTRSAAETGDTSLTHQSAEPAQIDRVLDSSRLVSDVTSSWLRTSHDDFVYVVVRLSGQIVSVTMAVDINEFDVGIAGSLTNPAYVLTPEAEGTVRGAGTAAIMALAEHFSRKGKRSLVSDVISQPSAIVKKKVGFKFIEEL
jgi:Beta/Gamma crystallin/Exotoxin A binding